MRAPKRTARAMLWLGVLAVTACGYERDITLRDLRTNTNSPEEFAVLPNKPLEIPETPSALPTPTPGSANRTDQTPNADAVAVLGGNPARLNPTGVPGSDGALISYAQRNGRDGNIRAELAADDLAFRTRRSLFTWQIVPSDDYVRAYRRQSLDAYRELERFRRAGVRTPAVPPPGQ